MSNNFILIINNYFTFRFSKKKLVNPKNSEISQTELTVVDLNKLRQMILYKCKLFDSKNYFLIVCKTYFKEVLIEAKILRNQNDTDVAS